MDSRQGLTAASESRPRAGSQIGSPKPKKIWVDLDNSPHVPFFAPIVDALRSRGYNVVITARDCFQVCELADLRHLSYRRVGRHYGRHKLFKLLGTVLRSLQLLPIVWREKPDIAVSHGSRSQLLAAVIARVPSLFIYDYEHARPMPGVSPAWVMVPEVIDASAVPFETRKVLKYPGIKEDVYVPGFTPEPGILTRLGLDPRSIIVVVRPPANEAHYHNPESEALFHSVIDLVARTPDAAAVLLPRTERQAESCRRSWPELFASRKLLIPDHAVDGLNLMWHSDVVVSGGGTMNREAAALGVPVYSIFRGPIGAVDRYLAASRRLVLLESVEDVGSKLILKRRSRPSSPDVGAKEALRTIVDEILVLTGAERSAATSSTR